MGKSAKNKQVQVTNTKRSDSSKFIFTQTAALFVKLPPDCQNSPTVNIFKKNLGKNQSDGPD
jgi:hypothetical protein